MENETINLVVENEQDEIFLIEIPSSHIQSGELREILRKQVSKKKAAIFILFTRIKIIKKMMI